MILNTGERWEPEDIDMIAWSKAYPAVDVFQELRAMESWLDANPTKRKTPREALNRLCESGGLGKLKGPRRGHSSRHWKTGCSSKARPSRHNCGPCEH